MSFDDLFQREYDYEKYNCLHFTVEAWRELFGVDLSFLTWAIVRDGNKHCLRSFADMKTFRRIQQPTTPCLCLMRSLAADETHVATYVEGRVLHIDELGVQYLLPEVILPQFKQVLFYEYHCDY